MMLQPYDSQIENLNSVIDSNSPQADRYGEAETQGQKWQKWLDDPNRSCPVVSIRITIRMLSLHYNWYVYDGDFPPSRLTATRYFPPGNLASALQSHHLPLKRKYTRVVLRQRRRPSKSGGGKTENNYLLQTGPGVIFALESKRIDGPHWSEIALAAYRFYEVKKLRYVFRVNIINPITTAIVREIYAKNHCQWPDRRRECWWHGTPEYQAILSTPNARGVAALVLGGFERGTRYIPVIMTWADTTHARAYLQMLFVICKKY